MNFLGKGLSTWHGKRPSAGWANVNSGFVFLGWVLINRQYADIAGGHAAGRRAVIGAKPKAGASIEPMQNFNDVSAELLSLPSAQGRKAIELLDAGGVFDGQVGQQHLVEQKGRVKP